MYSKAYESRQEIQNDLHDEMKGCNVSQEKTSKLLLPHKHRILLVL